MNYRFGIWGIQLRNIIITIKRTQRTHTIQLGALVAVELNKLLIVDENEIRN